MIGKDKIGVASVKDIATMYSMSCSTVNTLLSRAEFSKYIVNERPIKILLNPVTHKLIKNKKRMMYDRYR